MGEHDWFIHPKFRPLTVCKACGIVKRRDGGNSPCRGKVRVELRENRIAPTQADLTQPAEAETT